MDNESCCTKYSLGAGSITISPNTSMGTMKMSSPKPCMVAFGRIQCLFVCLFVVVVVVVVVIVLVVIVLVVVVVVVVGERM